MKLIFVLQKNKNLFVSISSEFCVIVLRVFTDNLEHFEIHDYDRSLSFDEQLIDKIQFSSLLTSFSGLKKNEQVVSALVDYFRSHYKETNEEKNEKKNIVNVSFVCC